MPRTLNSRAAAAKITWQIIDQGRSLDAALTDYVVAQQPSSKDKAFVQELVYGVCRWFGELDQVTKQFLRSPLRKKDRVVHFLLLVGFYQLRYLQTAEHAAVAETVGACKQLNRVWAKKLVNGCLRNYQRKPSEVSDPISVSHPKWIRDELARAWPNHALAIMHANNERPALCLRVNRLQCHRDDYLKQLMDQGIEAVADPFSADGIILKQAVGVSALPNFDRGVCSVQDTAAQLTAGLLNLAPNQTVLDACAAPGGKTAHILEHLANTGSVHALDVSEKRCEQLSNTLQRLNLSANVFCADATKAGTWPTPDNGYDRILIDAPCSGLGVIRRHPDIKHHRRPSDLQSLNKTQSALLRNLWPLLKPNGLLLYMTCSVLPTENEERIAEFVASQKDTRVIPIDHPNALSLKHGKQTLPGVHCMDGFYYSLLQKVDLSQA